MSEGSALDGSGRPVVAIHAGAGDHAHELQGHEEECREVLITALRAARDALGEGMDATHAVEAAVVVMENFELFNAGRGSTLCSDGRVEMSAALMRGSDRAAGAMAGLRHTENPISGARVVLESPLVLLAGAPADERAAQAGIRQCPNDHFVTNRQRARLREQSPGPQPATVGAVCLDEDGMLAAATSTGGVRGQPPGRVGDCPVIGAGTWADSQAAISCTGDGEAFIRCATAREVAALVSSGARVGEAADAALQQISELRCSGGLVAVDSSGHVAAPFTSPIMPRGVWRAGFDPAVWLT